MRYSFVPQLKQKPPQTTQGFTLLEVLVSVLVISAFVGVAMMGFAIAAAFMAKARTMAQATAWIQENLETVRSQAAQISYSVSQAASAGQANVPLSSTTGLTNGQQLLLGTDPNYYTIQSVSGNTVTLTTNLNIAQAANTQVAAVSQCNATTTTTGFGNNLQQNLPGSSSSTRTISGKSYTLTRTPSVRNTAPYEVLQLSYTVAPTSGGSTIAKMYTEVIPNAVYNCPKIQ